MYQDLNELIQWLDEQKITRQKKNLNRDFSDAIPLVEILKVYYPKLVDLHNYSARNGTVMKLANWNVLNKKVLNKLDINLSQKEQQDLSSAVPGAIESLLWKIKHKIENRHNENKSGDNELSGKIYFLDGISNTESINDVVSLKVRNGNEILDQRMLPVNMYEAMQRTINEQSQNVTELQEKVADLEQILINKNQEINELSQQLQTFITEHGDNANQSMRSRFFSRLF